MKEWQALFRGMSFEEIRPASLGAEPDPHRMLENEALAAGIVPFFEQALRRRSKITVLLNDPDRFTDSRLALQVIQEITRARRLAPRFRILFATGSHVFNAEQKRAHEKICLPSAAAFEKRDWHDARNPSAVRSVGEVELHHWVAEAEHLLVVGSMEPHYFAGVTGAHKTATVGVMSYESLRKNHYHAMSPRAASFALEGNPVHGGIAAVLHKLAENKHLFAINEVLMGGKLIACTAGEPLQALTSGLPHVQRVFSHRMSRPADLVIARVSPPLDKNLYQADKGIKNVETAVRDGGVILLEARCAEGVGPDRFMKLMEKAPTYEEAVEAVESVGYRLGDHKAVRLRALTGRRGVRLGIVSSQLGEAQARMAGLEPLSSPEEASRWAMACLGEQAKTAVLVEDAGNMTVSCDNPSA